MELQPKQIRIACLRVGAQQEIQSLRLLVGHGAMADAGDHIIKF
jgi:hypothetical protein